MHFGCFPESSVHSSDCSSDYDYDGDDDYKEAWCFVRWGCSPREISGLGGASAQGRHMPAPSYLCDVKKHLVINIMIIFHVMMIMMEKKTVVIFLLKTPSILFL